MLNKFTDFFLTRRDVKLTLVHKDLVDRGLSRSEEDDIEDSELSYDQISPLDKVLIVWNVRHP